MALHCPALHCTDRCRLAEFLSFIVFDPFLDLFITLCILFNTAFMALDHHNMDPAMNNILQNGNYVRLYLYHKSIKMVFHHLYLIFVFSFSLPLLRLRL